MTTAAAASKHFKKMLIIFHHHTDEGFSHFHLILQVSAPLRSRFKLVGSLANILDRELNRKTTKCVAALTLIKLKRH